MTTKYLEFVYLGDSESGKTKIYDVLSKANGSYLGRIKWYAPWRRYIFAANDSLFDSSCLNEIVAFLDSLMRARKDER